MRPCKAFGFEPSTLDRFTSMSTHSSISPHSFCSPASNSGFGPDALHRDTGVQGPDLQSVELSPPASNFQPQASSLEPPEPASPLQYALTQKRVCKFFGICTYESLDLKSPGMNSYKKHPGGVPPPIFTKLSTASPR